MKKYCDKCGKKDVSVSDGILINMINAKKIKYFICDSCLATNKSIEELVIEIDFKLKL